MKRTAKPIRLFWAENYAPKPLVVEAEIRRILEEYAQKINKYPSELYDEAVDIIADDYGVSRNDVLLSHGVEGLVHLIARAFLGRGKKGGTFDPSFFVFNTHVAKTKNPLFFEIGLQEDVDIAEFIKSIQKVDVFFLASPNKESGNYVLSHSDIEHVLENYKGLFVVDECYLGLGGMTVSDLLNKYNNLLIIRSLSKAEGLASLRVGFGVGSSKVISKLRAELHDLEYDPISSVQLMLFSGLYPYFPRIWEVSKQFFEDFYEELKGRFPLHNIKKTVTTNLFFDIRPSKVKAHELIMRMNGKGYLLSPFNPRNNNSRFTKFDNIVAVSAPPMEYWNDFFESLKGALAE